MFTTFKDFVRVIFVDCSANAIALHVDIIPNVLQKNGSHIHVAEQLPNIFPDKSYPLYHTLCMFHCTLSVCIQGQLVGVVGKVGSGKSSLLAAITAEMRRKDGQVSEALNMVKGCHTTCYSSFTDQCG